MQVYLTRLKFLLLLLFRQSLQFFFLSTIVWFVSDCFALFPDSPNRTQKTGGHRHCEPTSLSLNFADDYDDYDDDSNDGYDDNDDYNYDNDDSNDDDDVEQRQYWEYDILATPLKTRKNSSSEHTTYLSQMASVQIFLPKCKMNAKNSNLVS